MLGPALLAGAAGCAGLQLTAIKTTHQRPSNVAVYFRVEDNGGQPIGGLASDSFRIYEDGQLVSQYESKQTILNPEVAAIHYTLLLVDMSGSVTESGNGPVIAQAVGAFIERVGRQQKVGIYAFDGSPDLYPIVPFTDQVGSAQAGANQLATFKPKDPSTNLNGAIVKALEQLDISLGKASQPLKFGTLVVFTDGTDRANRVSTPEMLQRVRDKPFDVFAIGLGAEIKPEQLKDIGKSGTAMAVDNTAILKAFDDVGARVESRTKSYYLLSYCSPARAGEHEVRIEAYYKGGDAKGNETGSLKSDFDATGFGPGCDPNAPPTFDVTKGEALAPPPPKEQPPPPPPPPEKKKDTKAAPPRPPAPKPPPPPPQEQPPPPPPKPAQDFTP
jgi:hypothetical protein